jgi:cytochrome c556
MKNTVSKLGSLGVLLVSTSLVACSPGGGGGTTADDTPEGQAFTFRQGLMRTIAYKVARLRGMAQGEIPADEEAFKKSANDLVTLAGMITEGFIPNSDVEGSAALPAIWMNWSDFQQKAMDLQSAAQNLAQAANNGGMSAAQSLVQPVGQSCGGCHRPYRRRAETEE